eukprot:2724477-Rhodomonas_salina.1
MSGTDLELGSSQVAQTPLQSTSSRGGDGEMRSKSGGSAPRLRTKSECMLLRLCYAMSSTEPAYAATVVLRNIRY